MLAILEIFFFKTCHVMYSFDRPICLFLTMFPFYPDQVSNRNAKLACNSLDDRNSGMANFFFFFVNINKSLRMKSVKITLEEFLYNSG